MRGELALRLEARRYVATDPNMWRPSLICSLTSEYVAHFADMRQLSPICCIAAQDATFPPALPHIQRYVSAFANVRRHLSICGVLPQYDATLRNMWQRSRICGILPSNRPGRAEKPHLLRSVADCGSAPDSVCCSLEGGNLQPINPNLSIAQVLDDLESQIAHHKEREPFHTRCKGRAFP